MIQYSVEFTESAREDFFNLYCYETTHPKSLSTEKLKVAVTSLELMPERFPFFEEKPMVDKQIRIMKEGDVCIFYFINKETKIVSIIRMLYVQNVIVEQQLVTS
ncbi:MAG: type II toxin-antitoxin system RelE/ParE family toxin [Treponema sp.]|nr:type II toxin-antitoxin system RelE/ParE family toxin [Treponema sp.]